MSEHNASEKTYHHGDLRNALISAGITLLEQEGVAGIELRKVARLAGVSHAAPYRHFADKRALIAAIAEQGFTQLTAQLEAALATSLNGTVDAQDTGAGLKEELLLLGEAYIGFALVHPALMREMYSGLTVNRADFHALYATSKVGFGVLLGVLARGQAQGVIPSGPIEQTAVIIWAMLHGLAVLLIENQIPDAPDKLPKPLIAGCVENFYRGITAQSGG